MRGKKLIEKKKRYKRLKRACWIIFTTLLGIYLAVFLYMYLASQGPKSGEYFITRSTPHTVVFTGNNVPVNLVLNPSTLTSLPPEGGRQLDILIGVDNSLSTKSAFAMMKRTAVDFLENTDIERHQVGIVRMDDEARVIQGLSHNHDVLLNVINEIPEGHSTRIHDGLQAMNYELNSIRRRPGSLGVAIILSDGQSSLDKAVGEANRLKLQEGIFIASIGMGEYVNDDLMKKIASWESEYKKVTDVEDEDKAIKDLTDIYLNWKEILEQLVAVDVRVTEYYNQTGLRLIDGSVNATGTIDRDSASIQWTIPYLTTAPVTLQYAHDARDILWYQLDRATGSVSWKPVGFEKVEMPIHRKPKVIILSPLLLLLLLLLLFLALLPLLIAWLRRLLAARGPALLPSEIDQPTPFPTPDLLPGLQLDKLIRSTDPTIVVGLGGTGRWVLTYLKKAVMETNYGHMPGTVKFLLIDVYERELKGDGARTIRVGGVELSEDECLILNEGTTAPEKLLERTKLMSEAPASEPHLADWWPADSFKELTSEAFSISSGTKKRRPIGRMALFLDMEKGTEDSHFWTRIGGLLKEVDKPGKGMNVFIASSLSGGLGSGMFTDVAYLVRHIAEHEKIEGIAVHALLALQNSFGIYTDSLGLTVPNTFAALRELDRFLSCRDFHFPMIYSPLKDSSVNGTLRAPLLDNCYVFDGERAPFPLHKESPEYGVFPSMSDTVHTFLYNASGGAFDQEVRQRKAVGELEREESGHGVVCSLGTFVYRLPMFEFVQTFKYRFAKQIAADLFGLVKDEKGQWSHAPLSAGDIAILNKELDDFLTRSGAERSPADVLQSVALRDTEMLTAVVEDDRAFKNKDGYVTQHKINYTRYLAEYFMDMLNGNQEKIAVNRKRLFSSAVYVAKQLETCFREVRGQRTGHGRDANIALELLDAYHEVTQTVSIQLDAYLESQPPLVQYLETKETQQLESRKIDSSILVREYLYNDEMEKKLYDDYLGENVCNENLPRFVWHCLEDDGEVRIRLNLAADRLKSIESSGETVQHADVVTSLPEILLQSLWNIDITPYLETAFPDPEDVARNVYEKSSPLILFEKSKAVRHTLQMFLSLKKSHYLNELTKQLRSKFPSRDHVKGTDFRDVHAFSSVSVLDSLPLHALRPYEQAMKTYLALPVNNRRQLHIFAAEQNAALYEERLPEVKEPKHAFQPKFISQLEHLERTRLFASCACRGLLPNLFHYDAGPYYLEIPGESGQNWCFLTRKVNSRKSTPLDALRAFIKEKGWTETGENSAVPIQQIRRFLENNPPSKETLLQKEAELTTMKADKEIKPEVRNLLSFIHLILNEELKKLTKE